MRAEERWIILLRRANTPESCHHFVGDQQRFVLADNLTDLRQPAFRMRNHPRGALHHWFDCHCGITALTRSLSRLELLLHLANAFPLAFAIFARVGPLRLRAIEGAAIAIRRHDLVGLKEQAGVALVEK